MLLFVITIVVLAAVYWFWVRPMLKARPSLAHFWDQEQSFFTALRLKFAGLKERLTGAATITAGLIVAAHDQIAPIVAGVDITPLSSRVPPHIWPLILIGVPALMLVFRNLAERRNAAASE